MKFIVTQKNILNGVSRVSPLAGRNPQLPILQNILLEVKEGVMNLTCTDLEVGAHTTVAGKAEQDGSCVVSARQLLEYVQQLPSLEPIVFTSGSRNLTVTTKKFNARFPLATVDDFPLLPTSTHKKGVELKGKFFCQAIADTLFSAARDDTRPELHSVFINSSDGKINIVATDSFRLSEYIIPLPEKNKFSFLLPINTAQEIVRLFGDADSLQLLAEKNHITLKADNSDLSTRLIDGNYPDYRQIIPDKFTTNGVIGRDEVLRALKTLTVFLPRELRRVSVTVKPTQGVVCFKAQGGEGGYGEVEVDLEGEGEEVSLLFNIQYLIDGFQHITSDKGEILLSGASDPLLIRPSDNSTNQLYLVMPIQT